MRCARLLKARIILAAAILTLSASPKWVSAQSISVEAVPGFPVGQQQVCASVAGIKECQNTTPGRMITSENQNLAPTVAIAVAARLMAAGNSLHQANGGKIDELKGAVTANTTALAALTAELKQQNELTLLRLRAELLARIERLPIELAKDEQAYALLKQRLATDLGAVFAPRSP